mmetsp:Transcript_6518/g.19788  ORF Transcript_6518/g.19788 Transcript_6518/m.19788 type:complete len:269 (-) Transcript_6518:5-811(-)
MLVSSGMESVDCSFVTTETKNQSKEMSALEILCSVATNPASKQDNVADSKVRRIPNDRDVHKAPIVQRPMHTGGNMTTDANRQIGQRKSHTSSLTQSTDKSGSGRGSHEDKQASGPANRRSRRQDYTRFSADEERYLLEGIEHFGAGNWKKILTSYDFHWKRTPVDLKDKHRNMMKMRMRQKRKLERLSEQGGHESDVSNNCLRSDDNGQIKRSHQRSRKGSETQTSIQSLCNATTTSSPEPKTKLVPVMPVGNRNFRSELAATGLNS